MIQVREAVGRDGLDDGRMLQIRRDQLVEQIVLRVPDVAVVEVEPEPVRRSRLDQYPGALEGPP